MAGRQSELDRALGQFKAERDGLQRMIERLEAIRDRKPVVKLPVEPPKHARKSKPDHGAADDRERLRQQEA